MMLEEIGMRVRMARMTRRMSQAQLAATLDVSIPYISHIEQGKQAMSIVTLHAICDKLEVSADWVLRNNSPGSKRILDEEIVQILDGCTAAEKNVMLKMMGCMKEGFRSVAPEEE